MSIMYHWCAIRVILVHMYLDYFSTLMMDFDVMLLMNLDAIQFMNTVDELDHILNLFIGMMNIVLWGYYMKKLTCIEDDNGRLQCFHTSYIHKIVIEFNILIFDWT